jgi:hypothetical protein
MYGPTASFLRQADSRLVLFTALAEVDCPDGAEDQEAPERSFTYSLLAEVRPRESYLTLQSVASIK